MQTEAVMAMNIATAIITLAGRSDTFGCTRAAFRIIGIAFSKSLLHFGMQFECITPTGF